MNHNPLKNIAVFVFLILGQLSVAQETIQQIYAAQYTPVDQELYEVIAAKDQEYFDAYNRCDMKTQASLYADDLEFFHDQGGLVTSKQDVLNSIEMNICGKVTRSLVEGSLEVYPINNYGAVQIGYHKFFNNQEPDAESKAVKFIMVWKNENDSWKISKVISLH